MKVSLAGVRWFPAQKQKRWLQVPMRWGKNSLAGIHLKSNACGRRCIVPSSVAVRSTAPLSLVWKWHCGTSKGKPWICQFMNYLAAPRAIGSEFIRGSVAIGHLMLQNKRKNALTKGSQLLKWTRLRSCTILTLITRCKLSLIVLRRFVIRLVINLKLELISTVGFIGQWRKFWRMLWNLTIRCS